MIVVRRAAVLAGVAVLLPLSMAAQCDTGDGVGKACGVRYAGVSVVQGRVTDTVTPTCSPSPQAHTILVQLELSVGGEWMGRGAGKVNTTIPDAAGFRVAVSALPCSEGVWRTSVRVDGIGPTGAAFAWRESGSERRLSLVDCAG